MVVVVKADANDAVLDRDSILAGYFAQLAAQKRGAEPLTR